MKLHASIYPNAPRAVNLATRLAALLQLVGLGVSACMCLRYLEAYAGICELLRPHWG